jgi:hypothetical protein
MTRKDIKVPYKAPKILYNGHFQTIYPALFRKVNVFPPVIKRISTADGDFLDIGCWSKKNKKLAILSHGLEGNFTRPYIMGLVNALTKRDIDCFAWNYRGCSDEMNKKEILYHSGATYDLNEIVSFASDFYEEIYLIGFSLGGNLTLKYAGERKLNNRIKKVIAISVPLDLKSGSIHLSNGVNRIYEKRFLKSLANKLLRKNRQFPGIIDLEKLSKIKTLYEFDDKFTSKLHGFKNAEDYYQKCSSKNFVENIKVPTLILNAANDPMFTDTTMDLQREYKNPNIHYYLSEKGGHCGFGYLHKEIYWSENFVSDFITDTYI